mmetsp:Transcript_14062/g.21918  ORF Transcript_14062/g.21918 Transcript_14062/m.21918 type:complete len:99 (+) Transcript_14062:3250-3546(+)
MMETSKEIYWFGTCGNLSNQAFPILLDFGTYMPDLFGQANPNEDRKEGETLGSISPYILGSQQPDFAVVKVSSSWSKSMSITSLLIADLRAVNQDQSH